MNYTNDAAAIQDMLSSCSDRELQVLWLVARGATNHEIVGELYISDATVRTHIQHLRMKLRVRSRIELALLARDQGIGATRAAVPQSRAQ